MFSTYYYTRKTPHFLTRSLYSSMAQKNWDLPHAVRAMLLLEKATLEQKRKEIEEKLIMAHQKLQHQLHALEKAENRGK